MAELWQFGAQSGVFGLMLVIMYLVFRDQIKREREEKTFFRDNFFRVIGVAERQARVTEELVEPVKERTDLMEKVAELLVEIEALKDEVR